MLDISNKRFGRLTAKKPSGRTKSGNVKWLCVCDCGNERVVNGSHLRNGHTSSCGCYLKYKITSHGKWNSPEYQSYRGMLQRCNNPKNPQYKDYGERGITVCDDWQGKDGFSNFYRDMGDRSSVRHSIERIDNDKGYSAENCKWATREEQQNNRRACRYITIDGETKTFTQWCRLSSVSYSTARHRIFKLKQDPKHALGMV